MLFILLPVFNRSSITQAFAKQLSEQNIRNFKLILIDDASTDDTVIKVKEILPGTVVLNGGGNAWWAGSLQIAYKYLIENVKEPFDVLLINDDTSFNINFLEIGLKYLNQFPSNLIKATEIEVENRQAPFTSVFFNIAKNKFEINNDPEFANCTTTRGLFMNDNVFKKIGGFYPDLLPHYLSDYEYTIRAVRKGHKILCPEDLKVTIDLSTTGLQTLRFTGFVKYFRDLFSKRYAANPIYYINFIMLTQLNLLSKIRFSFVIIFQTFANFIRAFYNSKLGK